MSELKRVPDAEGMTNDEFVAAWWDLNREAVLRTCYPGIFDQLVREPHPALFKESDGRQADPR